MQPTLYTKLARRLPRPLFKFFAQKWVNLEFPRHLFIELNTSCNLSCWHCPRPKINEEMKYETFKKIVEEANKYGRSSFSLHLFGEPLMCSYIFSAISMLKLRKHTVLITTNGTLLQKYWQKLLQSGVDRIFISWRDGLHTESIRKLKKICVIRVFDKDEERARKQFPRMNFEVKKIHNYGGNIDSSLLVGERYPCYHLWLAPAIRYNGDFTLCCNDPNGKLVVGNLDNKTINEMWNSVMVKQFRKDHLNGVYTNICEECNVWTTYPTIF